MNSKSLSQSASRRDFIKQVSTGVGLGALSAGAGLVGPLAGAAERGKVLVGSQLYGWGQYYQRMNKTVNENLGEVLSAIRDAGYDYAEGSLDMNEPQNNVRFAEQLKAKGLCPVSFYTGGRLYEEGKAREIVRKLLEAAKLCRKEGFSIINCNPDPIGREKTEAELKVQVEALKELGQGLKQLNMRLGIHHHTPEMKNKAREFHFNFRNSEAGLVDFCYDVHWVYRGGVLPMQALADYGDRVVSWHLRQSRDGIWWEDLDKGDIDYEAVAGFSKQHRLPPFYTVELALENGTKITRSVVENHQRSREFVRTVFQG
jgi:inosose dehydratase